MTRLDRRRAGLGAALLATLGATAWLALQPDDAPVAPTAGERRPLVGARATAPARATSAPLLPPGPAPGPRSAWSEPPVAQLAAWQPPPPPPPPPAPPPAPAAAPPPPAAPPLPYQMIGRIIEGQGTKTVEVALLSGANRSLGVRAGDVIDGQWRVERVTPSGVSLVWLPGQLPQNLVFRPIP